MRGIHITPRVNIDERTREIAVQVRRAYRGDTTTPSEVSLEIEGDISVVAYDVHDGIAKFEVPKNFPSAGVYRARVVVACCDIGSIEIMYAPRMHALSAHAHEAECNASAWVEPDQCAPEKPKPASGGGCYDGQCPGTRDTKIQRDQSKYVEEL